MLLNETHLIPTNKFVLANYKTYRQDRVSKHRGGGVAVLVANSIRHDHLPLPELKTIEAIGVKIYTSTGNIELISAYHRPQQALSKQDLAQLIANTKQRIVAGDLNAKHITWNSLKNNKSGLTLRNNATANGYQVYGPTQPTHFPAYYKHAPDVLDIMLTSQLTPDFSLKSVAELTSDHNPLIITLSETSTKEQEPRLFYNYRKANWNRFRELLTNENKEDTEPITTRDELDSQAARYTANLQQAMKETIPKLAAKRVTKFDLPPGLIRSVAIKNAARRLWQRTRTPDLHKMYNKLNRQLRTDIQNHRAQQWENMLTTCNVTKDNRDTSKIWKLARRMTGQGISNPVLKGTHGLATTNTEKAQILAETLAQTFTLNPPNAESQTIQAEYNICHHFHPEPKATLTETETVTIQELASIVAKLPDGKAPGFDEITIAIIRQIPDNQAHKLVAIFNAAIRLQHFPLTWKMAKIITFHKAGKPQQEPTSYRPISLLSTIGKLLERILLVRLNKVLEDGAVIPNNQFGFRALHSTTHALTRMTSTITNAYNNNNHAVAIYLDVAKAFDRVWHQGLLTKMYRLGIPTYLIGIIKSYLKDRTFAVSWQDALSTTKQIHAGVPQGSVLGPTLFNIYTHDIPQPKEKDNITASIFADDFSAIAIGKHPALALRNLQAYVNTVSPWYAQWRIGINPTKTTATLYTKSAKKKFRSHPFKIRQDNEPPLKLDGCIVNWSTSSECLGITLDRKLRWSQHVHKVKNKANTKLTRLAPLLRSSELHLKTKLMLYKLAIRPIFTYAAPVWTGCTKTTLKPLQKLQNRALRMATGAPKETPIAQLNDDLGIPSVKTFTQNLARNFYAKTAKSANPLIHAISNIKVKPSDKHCRPIAARGNANDLPQPKAKKPKVE